MYYATPHATAHRTGNPARQRQLAAMPRARYHVATIAQHAHRAAMVRAANRVFNRMQTRAYTPTRAAVYHHPAGWYVAHPAHAVGHTMAIGLVFTTTAATVAAHV